MSRGSSSVRRAASFALVLAFAAPTQLPAFAQDLGAQADVGAQTGVDATATAPPHHSPRTVNKTGAASAPTREVRQDERPRISGAKSSEKGFVSEAAAAAEMRLPVIGDDANDGALPDAASAGPFAADAAGVDVAALVPVVDVNPQDQPDGVAAQLAGWVRDTRDNGKRPFAVIDKLGARIWVFAPDGTLLGAAPVLVGLARGDDSVAGIGDKKLAAISPQERTTPAGRFVAKFGPAAGEHKTVLWVDYADAISMHPVITTNPKEHRLKRIKSSSPADHRISFGCINVPATFYERVVLTSFRKRGGVVYILPDTRPVQEVFPAFAETLGAADAGGRAIDASDGRADRPSRDPFGIHPASTDPLAVDPPAPVGGPAPAGAPDEPIATQVASQPAADAPKHSRHTTTKRHARRTDTTPA